MMQGADSLPWHQLMRIAFGAFGLTSEAFWQMTPVEWNQLWKAKARHCGWYDAVPPGRAELQEMMARFPDYCASMAEPR